MNRLFKHKKSATALIFMVLFMSFICSSCKITSTDMSVITANIYGDAVVRKEGDGSFALRAATFNTRACNEGKNIAEAAAEIKSQNAQIVFVQEMDHKVKRSGKQDILQQLSMLLEMNYAFYPALEIEGGTYGIGILSKFTLQQSESIALETKQEEPRVLAKAKISVNNRDILLYNTHLSFESEELRLKQLQFLNEQTTRSGLFILGGDFNVKNFEEYAIIQNSHAANTPEHQFITYKDAGDGLFGCIDNLIIPESLAVLNSWMAESTVSDHNLLISEIRIPSEEENVSRETSTDIASTTDKPLSGPTSEEQKGD